MSEEDRRRFDRIVESIAPRIQGVNHFHGSVYTFHDFNHHCTNIYHIIDGIVLTDDAYVISDPLTERELYLLNLSVLLHDIGMHKVTYVNRNKHAIESAKIIEAMYNNSESALSVAHSGISKNEIKALKRIVIAHSDNKPGVCELDSEELNETINDLKGTIRVKLLAAILRIADELDITSERIGSLRIKEELSSARERLTNEIYRKEMTTEERKDLENSVESLEYWKRLEYISSLEPQPDGIVVAKADDEEINKQIELGESQKSIVDALTEIEKKIQLEYGRFKKIIDSSVVYSHITGLKGFRIESKSEHIIRELYRTNGGENVNGKENDRASIKVLSQELSNKITRFVKKRELIEGGHFYRQDGYCARDWINVREIIGTGGFFRECEELLLSYVSSVIKNKNKVFFLIGIDFSGMLIGSKISVALNLPYAYAIPHGENTEGISDRELTVYPDGNYDGVVIITDVIVTFHTISRILKRYKLEEKEVYIVGVLYRNPIEGYRNDEYNELRNRAVVLNKDFDIELQCNSNCLIKEQYGCIALNLPSR